MAAAVEAARNGRTPLQIGVFLHRQRVHVGAKPDAPGARAFPPEHADNAGAADAAVHLDAPFPEFFGNDAGRTHFLEADLRMSVQVAADGSEFVGIALDAIDSWHCLLSGYP